MAKSPTKPSQRIELNTFVQGLITEASPLNFPVNASVDEENFELNRDGTRDRRRGMDYEPGYVQNNTLFASSDFYGAYGYSNYVWKSVGGNASKEYLVVQMRNTLYVYDTQKVSVSGNGILATIVISEFPSGTNFSYATVDGYLVVVAGVDVIVVVDQTFSYTTKRLKTRDVWGIEITGAGADDAYEIYDDYRGSASTPQTQLYNLQNQSWGIPRRTATLAEFDPSGAYAVMTDPLGYFLAYLTKYPSNSETVFSGLQFAAGSGLDVPSERMYTKLYDDVRGLGQKAAKGYFIIDLLRRGQTRIEESQNNKNKYDPNIFYSLSSTKADLTSGGARVARGFAGRVFYSGFSGDVFDGDARSPNLSNFVVFSQLVKNISDINKCYQAGDPTSRDSPDIVDTDGGFIKVSGADRIVGLRALGNSLIVFATNGIWEILGGSDYGFSATNYKVTKLSSIGAFSESTIVEEVGRLFFWGQDGIYVVGPDQFQTVTVKSITQASIQTLYDNIGAINKERATGVYDLFSKKIRWVYNAGLPFHETSENRELVFDTLLNAFYENRIYNSTLSIELVGAFVSAPYTIGQEATNVLAGPDRVLAGPDIVTIDQATRESKVNSVKYITLTNISGQLHITFSYYNDILFRDWFKHNSVGDDAKAFLLTGARTAGDSAVDKQIPYIFMHFRRTENGVGPGGELLNPSSCLMRYQWDFANTAESMKFTPMMQVYRYNLPKLVTAPGYDTGFDVITSKSKVRGRGKAFSMYLETEPQKDCRILGWNISVNGNAIA